MRIIKNQITTSIVKTAPDEICVTDSKNKMCACVKSAIQTEIADITEEVKCNCPLVFIVE